MNVRFESSTDLLPSKASPLEPKTLDFFLYIAGGAMKLQRPLPDGSLRIVARGVKEDPAGPVT